MTLYNRPLNPEACEIRCVRFQQHEAPASHPFDSRPIMLEMRIVSLNDSLPFSALSYVWGDSKDTVDIAVNNSTFAATKNLHAALQELDQIHTGWLWIDALCIDMSNNEERAQQVSYMHKVYSIAHQVYLWLGPGSIYTDMVMAYIAKHGPEAVSLKAEFRRLSWGDPQNADLRRELERCMFFTVSAEDETTKITCPDSKLGSFYYRLVEHWMQSELFKRIVETALEDILSRTYWNRIWIIQELVLAKSPIIMVGKGHMPLGYFTATIDALHHWSIFTQWLSHDPGRRVSRILRLPDAWYPIRPIVIRQLLEKESEDETDVFTTILWTTIPTVSRPFYTATDSRDILYGLLALRSQILKRSNFDIQADYNRSVAEVFTILTRALLHHPQVQSSKSPSKCFLLDQSPPNSPYGPLGLPTWVPNWKEVGLHGITLLPIGRIGDFNACGSRPAVIELSTGIWENDRVLRLSGYEVDEIQDVMERPAWEVPALHQTEYFRLIAKFTDLGTRSRTEEEQIWRTVACISGRRIRMDLEGNQFPLIREGAPDIWRKMMRGKRIRVNSLTPRERDILAGGRFRSRKEKNKVFAGKNVAFLTSVERSIALFAHKDRKLFKTKKGMLGLGREGVEKGDLVTILWGNTTPIVLQRRQTVDSTFYFRGDAYIDGLMFGEFLGTKPLEKTFCIY
ncbi:heterokaryon incompatibility protein-domain-containing protein [Cercophora samala]|uniref:Heterokaryon incompatibility protein-domain-containing protein n=1 Tax=Cercophora samala TaxID=330535 RepID=A0AA40D659_9PEZI|nr:heterokaryon incompatibility protein-domain-containing protein [Cercophora samala]